MWKKKKTMKKRKRSQETTRQYRKIILEKTSLDQTEEINTDYSEMRTEKEKSQTTDEHEEGR